MSKESIWPFSTLRVRKCSMRPRAASPSSSRHLATDGLEARLDRKLRDARAHRPQPDDSDLHEGGA